MGQQEIRKILDEVTYPGHSYRVGGSPPTWRCTRRR